MHYILEEAIRIRENKTTGGAVEKNFHNCKTASRHNKDCNWKLLFIAQWDWKKTNVNKWN